MGAYPFAPEHAEPSDVPSVGSCALAPSSSASGLPVAGLESSGRERSIVSYSRLALLTRIAKHLSSAEATEAPLIDVLVWLSSDQGLSRGVITLMNEAGDEVQGTVTAAGISAHLPDKGGSSVGEEIRAQVFGRGEPFVLPRLESDTTLIDRAALHRDLDPTTLAFFCVPIVYRGRPIGTLSADKDNRALEDAGGDVALLQEVGGLLAAFMARRRLEDRLEIFQRMRHTAGAFERLVGRSEATEEVRRLVAKVASVHTTVLLTGETGTGKGVVASMIHELSPRRDEPFVEVNCGAIPESLIESELFGHEKGAFTGAHQRRIGVLERARGGTVFLDEVGELPPSAQTRLLRVLQTRLFERVAGGDTLTFHARVIAATNRDLEAAIASASFRSDLFYRLSVFPITMPPLRDRGKADVMLLVDSFIQRFSQATGKRIFRIDTPAIDMLTAYHWPGNVRELENVIERAVVLAEGDVLHGHHLPPSLQMNRYAAKHEAGDFATRLANFEIELITEALKDASGNQTKAAERLGMTKRVMQYKIRQYRIDWKRFK